jgi:hypothetical protein
VRSYVSDALHPEIKAVLSVTQAPYQPNRSP